MKSLLLPKITYKDTLVQHDNCDLEVTAVLDTVAWLTGRWHGRGQTATGCTDSTLSLGNRVKDEFESRLPLLSLPVTVPWANLGRAEFPEVT